MKTLLLCSALALALASAASATVTEKFTQTYPLSADGTISLDNINGSVEIVAWNKAEVSLVAEKSAKDEEGLKRMHIKVESLPGRLNIKTEHEKRWKFWESMNARVDYKLMVPAGASLDDISVVNARIIVKGMHGSVHLEAVNGNIEAEGLTGPGSFETVNGSVEVTYASIKDARNLSLETVNGSCTLVLPADAAFDLNAETVNGRISCDFPLALEKSGKRDLRGTVNGGGTALDLESVNGSLSVRRAK